MALPPCRNFGVGLRHSRIQHGWWLLDRMPTVSILIFSFRNNLKTIFPRPGSPAPAPATLSGVSPASSISSTIAVSAVLGVAHVGVRADSHLFNGTSRNISFVNTLSANRKTRPYFFNSDRKRVLVRDSRGRKCLQQCRGHFVRGRPSS